MGTRTARRIALASVAGVIKLGYSLVWLGRDHVQFENGDRQQRRGAN